MLVFNEIQKKYEIIEDIDFVQFRQITGFQKADNKTDARGNLIKPNEKIYFGNKLTGKHINCENINSYFLHGEETKLDYKQVRRKVKEIIEAKGVTGLGTDLILGLENLDSSELTIASKMFIIRGQYSTLDVSETQKYAEIFHEKSKNCRRARMELALLFLMNSITIVQKSEVLPLIPDYELYINIQQQKVIDFINTDLRTLSYVTDLLADTLIDILENGV